MAKQKDPKRRKTRKDKRTATSRIDSLSDEQLKFLDDIFFRQHKGTLGVRALWEILKQQPQQQVALSDGKKRPEGYVSWRDVRAYHAAQETVQRHARANKRSKTLVNLPTEEQMRPFVRFQLDTIVMAQGNNKRDDDSAWRPGQSLTETKDKRGLPDNGMRVVYHLIDLFTNYSFLAAAPKNNQDNAIRSVQEFIEAIRLQYGDGGWPGGKPFTVTTDAGEEYQSKFQREVTEYEPLVRLVRNPAGNPNADAVVEGANGVFRRIAKRYAENTKSKRSGNKSYLAYWFGSKKGEILQEINALMNNRPVSSLGYQTPASVLEAAMNPNPSEEDKQIVAKATSSKQGTAKARRSASHITAYKKGDKVRRISDQYIKSAGMRGNVMKQQPQWGQVQTVTAVQKRAGFVPRYQLDGGENWIAHDRLNLVPDGIVLKPPPAALEDPDFFVAKKLPDRVFYRGYPLAERRENLEGDDAPPAAEQRAAASLSALLN
eukprot:COSAG03_NODE_3120_length_2202_cov_0.786020_2_plen_488_part_00